MPATPPPGVPAGSDLPLALEEADEGPDLTRGPPRAPSGTRSPQAIPLATLAARVGLCTRHHRYLKADVLARREDGYTRPNFVQVIEEPP
ncbi:hypothetical protein AB0D04_14610 [Streptomyces sp. NPDC048483]|uniref:hypothetical protein n=1 Tax=Streptomyces sp. NPDC048483 TaxID=3154927 RepID=UPI0034233F04